MAQPKKKPFRFSAQHDICLLKEVLAQNPFQKDGSRVWAKVAERLIELDMMLDARRCRKCTSILLEYHQKEDQEMLKK